MSYNQIQDSDMTKCIHHCLNTYRTCLETLHYCFSNHSVHATAPLISTLQLCADASNLSAKAMIADSEFHQQSCELCFEVCQKCAEELELFAGDSTLLKAAEICRQCARSCRGMAGMIARVQTEKASSQRSLS